MSPLIITLPGAPDIEASLAMALGATPAEMTFRHFPDGERYVRYISSPKDRDIIFLTGLTPPDGKYLDIVFAADTARDLGARSIGLIAPYLPYMRQDKRFQSGEAITSRIFATLLSQTVDWLVTVDPHLHRWHALTDIYAIPAVAVSASSHIADWVRKHVETPLIVGPDSESEQWASRVAEQVGAPYTTGVKTRQGDTKVALTLPDVSQWSGRTPVIVDDTISTATTMIALIQCLKDVLPDAPVCCAVHGLFAQDAEARLRTAGAGLIVTANTVPHPTNAIDVTRSIAMAAADLLRSGD